MLSDFQFLTFFSRPSYNDLKVSPFEPLPGQRLGLHCVFMGRGGSDNPLISFSHLQTRQLVKDGFLVEMAEGTRKLRHVFLFTDVLLCAKLKKTAVG